MHREHKTFSLSCLFGASLAAVIMLFHIASPPDVVGIPQDMPEQRESQTSYAGRFLVAAPGMRDPRFRETVILLTRHDESGAFGLVVNRVLGRVELSRFLEGLGINPPKDAGEIVLHYGGPVELNSVFVMHSTELEFPNSQKVSESIAVSSDPEMFRAIAQDRGPRRIVLAMGYAGWGPGQLEAEMRRRDWFIAPVDEDILFDDDQETKWKRAMALRFQPI